MDLELRISQYIDGELSGEEEAELHHMLAVSPEARALFRQHLTLHTIARDERVLHRPEQSMRDNLFARLQAEEGMKSSAVALASVGAGAATLAAADTERRMAEDRPPIAAEDDRRAEERRRRRRLIPILIPLLLCVIVGGVWYGGGFGGNGGSGDPAIAGHYTKKEAASAATDRDYTDPTDIHQTNPADDSLIPSSSSSASSSEHLADAFEPEGRSASSHYRSSSAGARAPEPESLAWRSDNESIEETHDVLGISSSTDFKEENESSSSIDFDQQGDFAYEESNDGDQMSGLLSQSEVRDYGIDTDRFDWSADGDDLAMESTPPLQEGMGLTLIPQKMTANFAQSNEANSFGEDNLALAADSAAADMYNEIARTRASLAAPTAMYNSISPSDNAAFNVIGGRLYDTTTGQPVILTRDNYEQFGALLQSQGLTVDGSGKQAAPTDFSFIGGGGNTGNRSIKETVIGGGSGNEAFAQGSAREKGEGGAPLVMSSTLSGGQADVQGLQADSVQLTSSGQNKSTNVEVMAARKTLEIREENSGSREIAASSSASSDFPLDPSSSGPRGVNFFVGLDQSVGATVNSIEVKLPFPTSSFSDNGGLSSETRVVFGMDFDNGRQRVFATVGAWGYDERESVRSREINRITTGTGTVNTITTTMRDEERTAYEVWGGGGYRYSVRMSRNLDAGAEVWAGVGGEYVHAGFSIPLSYQLKDNLELEISPELRYRALHNTAEQVTTGTPASDSYEERIITPKDDHRLEGGARIGLILLLR